MSTVPVTLNRCAAAFEANGEFFYLLFEETLDNPDIPHTKCWECIFLGTYSGAVREIFHLAAKVEVGALQNADGTLRAEAYIAGWMVLLTSPNRMPDLTITLRHSQADTWGVLPTKQVARVCQVFEASGYSDIAQALATDNDAIVTLYAHATELAQAYNCFDLSPGRIISGRFRPLHQPRMKAHRDLAPPNAPKAPRYPQYALVNRQFVLSRMDDGPWRFDQTLPEVQFAHVEGLAQFEIADPGSYVSNLAESRALLANAVVLEGQIIVEVDYEAARDDEERHLLNLFIHAHDDSCDSTGVHAITIPCSLAHAVARLPRHCVTWRAAK